MINGTVSGVANLFESAYVGADRRWQGVSTDTRTLSGGQLFFALNGPNFRGTDFVAAARERGAAAAVVEMPVDDVLPQIPVADTRLALGRLGSDWRSQLEITVIGVTGSNGKTTVKQMLAACLGPGAYATRGNLNNEIGVPLTLAELDSGHDFAVIEMGANHAGEIGYLASLVLPDVAVVTNAGPSHLEGFGSVEGVARAKGELFAALGAGATAIINRDDIYHELWASLATPARKFFFGHDDRADCYPRSIKLDAKGARFDLCLAGDVCAVELPLPGLHNVLNACAAALAAHSVGVAPDTIAARLGEVQAASRRLNLTVADSGSLIVDDSYNANPMSVRAAASLAIDLGRPVWMAVGDMGELGCDAPQLHRELGADLCDMGIDRLYATGELSVETAAGFGDAARHYPDRNALVEALLTDLTSDVTIVVKGSRSTRMDIVADRLLDSQLSNRGGGQ